MCAHRAFLNSDAKRTAAQAGGGATRTGRGIDLEFRIEIHRLLLGVIVLEIHSMAKHVVDGHIFRTAVQANATVRRAVGTLDRTVMFLENGKIGAYRVRLKLSFKFEGDA